MSEEILTKTLGNGSSCTVGIVPDPTWPDEETTTLSWYLEITIGGAVGRMKARPHAMAKAHGDRTHALTLPPEVARTTGAKVLGLTADEADRITAALRRWVDDRKAANAAAREQAVAKVRAAAPGAPTRTISSPYSVPTAGVTVVWDDGSIVTSLRTWHRYFREDGRSFGADDDSGYVYYAEVRDATLEEAAQLRGQVGVA